MFGNYIAARMGSAVLVKPNKIVTNAHVVLDEDGNVAD